MKMIVVHKTISSEPVYLNVDHITSFCRCDTPLGPRTFIAISDREDDLGVEESLVTVAELLGVN